MASLLNMSGSLLKMKGLPQGAVDMGLPSGTLWAQGNIIKDAQGNYAIGEPADDGCYFSWGNIDGHNVGDGYSFSTDNYALTTGSGKNTNIASDDTKYDAAAARLSNGWHIPTPSNFQELFNISYTTKQWTSVNGVKGFLLTSIANDNTLFLPASGDIVDSRRSSYNAYGDYWTNSRSSNTRARNFFFNSNQVWPENNDNARRVGCTIRPVI